MTARNRDEATDDSVLSVLDTLDYDQLWLMAVDTGHGLSPGDSAGIMRFRERGGGVLTARDHQDLGSCLSASVRSASSTTSTTRIPEPHARRDDQDNPNISWPNYHSGANGEYQPVMADEPAHELLRTDRNPSGRIEWFPAHPHEGAVSAPPETTRADRRPGSQHGQRPYVQPGGRPRRRDRGPTAAQWAGRWRARPSTTSPT